MDSSELFPLESPVTGLGNNGLTGHLQAHGSAAKLAAKRKLFDTPPTHSRAADSPRHDLPLRFLAFLLKDSLNVLHDVR